MEGGAYKKMSHMEVQLKTTFRGLSWGKGHSNYNRRAAVLSVSDVLLRTKK